MKRKWMIALGTVVGLIIAGFFAFYFLQAPEVEVKQVSPETMTRSFTEDAVVVSREDIALQPLASARIEKILVAEGDTVKAGELLAVLDDAELDYALQELSAQLKAIDGEAMHLGEKPGEAQLEQAENLIEQAEKSLALAENRHERIDTLHEFGVVSDQELEDSEAVLQQAQHNLQAQEDAKNVLIESYDPPPGSYHVLEARRESIRSQMELIRYQKENYYQVKSPLEGVVAEVHAEVGETAAPQAPIIEVFSEENYKVESDLLTRDIFDIKEGMEVDLILEKREEETVFPGTITKISPRAREAVSPLGLEEERVKVTISPEFPEHIELGPGYGLEAEFIIDTEMEKLIVPKTAIFIHQGEDTLYVVEEETIALRQVKTGLEDSQDVVIESGLEAGDIVVINPQAAGVSAGDQVRPRLVND